MLRGARHDYGMLPVGGRPSYFNDTKEERSERSELTLSEGYTRERDEEARWMENTRLPGEKPNRCRHMAEGTQVMPIPNPMCLVE